MAREVKLQLSTVRIFVRDLRVAADFYKNVLGFKLKVRPGTSEYCVFDAGQGIVLVIEKARPNGKKDTDLVGRFTGISFSTRKIRECFELLKEKGVSLSGPPVMQDWGGMLTTFKDPDGNEFSLIELPQASKGTVAGAPAATAAVSEAATDAALSLMASIEEKIANLEHQAQALTELAVDQVASELKKKAQDKEVEEELKKIKESVKRKKEGGTSKPTAKLVVDDGVQPEKKQLPARIPKRKDNLPARRKKDK